MTALVLAAAVAIAAPVPKDAGGAELERKVAPARLKAIKFLRTSRGRTAPGRASNRRR
jgi:hypothetical protein